MKNLKVKALAIVAGFFAGMFIVQAALGLALEAYGSQAVINTFVGGVLMFLVYQMYTLILQRLQHQETLKELSKKVDQ
jgi:nitrate reductase gamma subunit